MKRAFTLVELLMVTAVVVLLAAAFAVSTARSRQRAKLSRAESDMMSIAAEIALAPDPDASLARYQEAPVCDPWGTPYRVKLSVDEIRSSSDISAARTAVWCPNAYSPRKEVR